MRSTPNPRFLKVLLKLKSCLRYLSSRERRDPSTVNFPQKREKKEEKTKKEQKQKRGGALEVLPRSRRQIGTAGRQTSSIASEVSRSPVKQTRAVETHRLSRPLFFPPSRDCVEQRWTERDCLPRPLSLPERVFWTSVKVAGKSDCPTPRRKLFQTSASR
ncbi:hypothetical protein NPIL_471971 [Nephila pilipes]|uniref:Uncharacterized protein n=1 Tax=Nephila pilipes TaxID=299642 RepID=A0A8X6N4K1_NEPPI|nr:hypothetical protein NPIL_471971 [Nephila pilipes]